MDVKIVHKLSSERRLITQALRESDEGDMYFVKNVEKMGEL